MLLCVYVYFYYYTFCMHLLHTHSHIHVYTIAMKEDRQYDTRWKLFNFVVAIPSRSNSDSDFDSMLVLHHCIHLFHLFIHISIYIVYCWIETLWKAPIRKKYLWSLCCVGNGLLPNANTKEIEDDESKNTHTRARKNDQPNELANGRKEWGICLQ